MSAGYECRYGTETPIHAEMEPEMASSLCLEFPRYEFAASPVVCQSAIASE